MGTNKFAAFVIINLTEILPNTPLATMGDMFFRENDYDYSDILTGLRTTEAPVDVEWSHCCKVEVLPFGKFQESRIGGLGQVTFLANRRDGFS